MIKGNFECLLIGVEKGLYDVVKELEEISSALHEIKVKSDFFSCLNILHNKLVDVEINIKDELRSVEGLRNVMEKEGITKD